VVTAFIAMSGIKDEIDWEFPGANTTTGQTDFFWQGNIRGFSVPGTRVCRGLTYGQPIRRKVKSRLVSPIPTPITMPSPCAN
jgi:Glycosyl hydrolases family 16